MGDVGDKRMSKLLRGWWLATGSHNLSLISFRTQDKLFIFWHELQTADLNNLGQLSGRIHIHVFLGDINGDMKWRAQNLLQRLQLTCPFWSAQWKKCQFLFLLGNITISQRCSINSKPRLILLWSIFYCISSLYRILLKGLICIWCWKQATVLSRCSDPVQAVDPNNPEHISSATTVQWQDEEDSTETVKRNKQNHITLNGCLFNWSGNNHFFDNSNRRLFNMICFLKRRLNI